MSRSTQFDTEIDAEGKRRVLHTDKLSPREQEVAEFICQGKSNKEIADLLHITQSSVKNYVYRMFDKRGVVNRAQLAAWWASEGKKDHETREKVA